MSRLKDFIIGGFSAIGILFILGLFIALNVKAIEYLSEGIIWGFIIPLLEIFIIGGLVGIFKQGVGRL